VEGSASAPTHPDIELEPPEWQPRAMWVAGRQLCGAASFFFISFVFAYFYLRSLDLNKDWKIGHNINPSLGLGVAILVALILSAALLRAASRRPELTVSAGGGALTLMLLAVVLQVVQWTTLGFGPASGGYASVFVGWTVFYAVFALMCGYWIETQIATAWRRRQGVAATPAHVLTDDALVRAGLEACSFFWAFYVGTGVVAFVMLYLL
jgi:hypothetical protein